MITPVQSKMARAALGWSVRELSKKAQIGVSTIVRFELGKAETIPATVAAMQRAFEKAGIEFISEKTGLGVRLKKVPNHKR
jgi:ribosome-binding protein aMBF1 (putative translation factor)